MRLLSELLELDVEISSELDLYADDVFFDFLVLLLSELLELDVEISSALDLYSDDELADAESSLKLDDLVELLWADAKMIESSLSASILLLSSPSLSESIFVLSSSLSLSASTRLLLLSSI